MTLGGLLAALNEAIPGGAGLQQADAAALAKPVRAIVYDSRRAAPGALFVALRGLRHDATAFAAQAAARGAMAVVAEAAPAPGVAVPWITVGDARAALAVLAARFFGDPSRAMKVVGITGTNGKTTTAYLLAELFEAAGVPCGLMGTVVYRVGREEREASRTTPEAPDVQHLLREMLDGGAGACVMEVSSHALELARVNEVQFAAAVFTNLTRDHLDFHHDMESYFRSKRRLFERLPGEGVRVVNVDDPRGPALLDGPGRLITYGIDRPADVRPIELALAIDGLSFDAQTPAGLVRVRSRLIGRPNTYNVLAALATAVGLGLPVEAIERGFARIDAVPGRFQVASGPQDELTVIVDYAHTDDALKNLLETARPLAANRLITVFGCGGDRDRTKRPLMGAVAARLSDLVIITSDNPRSEEPSRIIDEIKLGLVPPADRPRSGERQARLPQAYVPAHLTIVDRRKAIERAIELARPGDMVLIAGKGHEKYQVIGERVLPFDDVTVAREALERRRRKTGEADASTRG